MDALARGEGARQPHRGRALRAAQVDDFKSTPFPAAAAAGSIWSFAATDAAVAAGAGAVLVLELLLVPT